MSNRITVSRRNDRSFFGIETMGTIVVVVDDDDDDVVGEEEEESALGRRSDCT